MIKTGEKKAQMDQQQKSGHYGRVLPGRIPVKMNQLFTSGGFSLQFVAINEGSCF